MQLGSPGACDVMESSTGHLVLCNRVNLSGCGWLKPDQASSSQFNLV